MTKKKMKMKRVTETKTISMKIMMMMMMMMMMRNKLKVKMMLTLMSLSDTSSKLPVHNDVHDIKDMIDPVAYVTSKPPLSRRMSRNSQVEGCCAESC